jgi:hypothetical protein
MKKFIMILTGMAFLLSMSLSVSFGQYKEEKKKPGGIPSQDTIHLEKTTDKSTKQMQKDIDALKSGQTAPAAQAAPAAPETKAAVTAAPPAADPQAAAKDKKKSKKSKKDKKDKKATNN